VKVVDLNLLLYAVNRDSVHHTRAKAWLERTLSADEPVALPWAVVLGFIRIATSERILPRSLTVEQALRAVDSWIAQPVVVLLVPGMEHWRVLRALLAEAGTAGNLTTDAHLAALAIESGAELCSSDSDFARFPGLRWTNPLT